VIALNATHDPALRSWLASANQLDTDFPIQNLPFGLFRPRGQAGAGRCCVAIGDQVLDLSLVAQGLSGLAEATAPACRAPLLNPLMACEAAALSALRAQLSAWLSEAADAATVDTLRAALSPMTDVELLLPWQVAGYTDFFASIHHATNAGRLFRPDQPLLPNYKHVPIAYNGRANSVRVSGEAVIRPNGQGRPLSPDAMPSFGPAQRLDHEVELGLVVGRGSRSGEPIAVADAWRHVFGFCLLNDWSARDIQFWEYQPLGPFLAKSFATSVSPWIVTAEALAPFRTPAAARDAGDPVALPYLSDAQDQAGGALGLTIEASLSSQAMRAAGRAPLHLSRSDAATLYWTFAQMLSHHTSNGCALDTGDLLGSGTISGADDSAMGSLMEISAGGSRPLALPGGEQRTFLQDGDEVALSGHCVKAGHRRIGFGECKAVLLPARAVPFSPSGPA
jgi:fumarylacetoacetase